MSLRDSIERRLTRLIEIGANEERQQIELELCRRDPVYWINTWGWTYNPKEAASGATAYVPFDLFPKQADLIRYLEDRTAAREEGLVEKSRDIGFTWVAAAFAAHRWRFSPGFKTTFGSRDQDQVDHLGDPDSIFEKMRMFLYRLPAWMMPAGFNRSQHDNFMRLLNPENGNTITGECGDNMGRGGRSSLYVVDEGAFLQRPERVEAAIVANADCRIWASTVNGMGNLFGKKRHSGSLRPDQIFRYHWRDDPRKDDAWAAQKQRELAATPHIWASEYELDYAASVEGVCIPAAWVAAAVELAALVEVPKDPHGTGGLDVGGGKAKSVFIARFGPLVLDPKSWGEPDTTETAHRALDAAVELGTNMLNYDSVGIGAGVSSTLSRHSRPGIKTIAVNVGRPASLTIWPDGSTSAQRFANAKAEAWWLMRDRFRSTYEHVRFLKGEEGGLEHPLDELVSLPVKATQLVVELSTPKWFRNEAGKIILETKQQLATRGVASPDFADALALTFVVPRFEEVPFAVPIIVSAPR